jgi:ATP-dependent DNA helicase PIF1
MVSLNDEQLKIIDKIQNNNNVLITGGGGVGKSFTIHYIINWAKNNNKNIGICAMTGSAAILINGTTLHSFLGIGLGKDSVEYLISKILKNSKLKKKLSNLNILIIDEISMLNDELFTKISEIFKIIKKSTQPFGGIQIILVGDLFQLAPIECNYCFLAPEWDNTEFSTFLLESNMRQKNDQVFKNILDKLRWGKCSDDDFKILLSLKKTIFPNTIIPTRLYSKNNDVDRINNSEYIKLLVSSNDIKAFSYNILYPINPTKNVATKSWIKNLKIPETINLCVGAQIMITHNINIDAGLINGTRGVIIDLFPKYILIKLTNDTLVNIEYFKFKSEENDNIECSFLPIRLAWAISIHKSQGMTIDALEIDLGKDIFAYGQAYTALSRGKNLNSIKLINVEKYSFRASPAVIAFYSNL